MSADDETVRRIRTHTVADAEVEANVVIATYAVGEWEERMPGTPAREPPECPKKTNASATKAQQQT